MTLDASEAGMFGKEAPTDITDERGTRYYRQEVVQDAESVRLNALTQRFLSQTLNPYLEKIGVQCRVIGSIAANAGVREGKVSDIDLQAFNMETGELTDPDSIYSIINNDEFIRLCQFFYNGKDNENNLLDSFIVSNNLTMPVPRIEMFGPSRDNGTMKGYWLELEKLNISI